MCNIIHIIKSFIIFEGSRAFYAKSLLCLLVVAIFGSTGYHVRNSIRSATYLFNSLFRTEPRLPER
jgi:hypothetical protein